MNTDWISFQSCEHAMDMFGFWGHISHLSGRGLQRKDTPVTKALSKLSARLVLCHDFVCDVVVPSSGNGSIDAEVPVRRSGWLTPLRAIKRTCLLSFCIVHEDLMLWSAKNGNKMPTSSQVTASPYCHVSWPWMFPAQQLCHKTGDNVLACFLLHCFIWW